MKNYQKKDEVLLSWRRCMEQNLSANNNCTDRSLTDGKINELLHKNETLISTFEEIMKDIHINRRCLFLYYQI